MLLAPKQISLGIVREEAKKRKGWEYAMQFMIADGLLTNFPRTHRCFWMIEQSFNVDFTCKVQIVRPVEESKRKLHNSVKWEQFDTAQ